MRTDELFLAADAALRSVVDRLTPADLEHPVPADWSRTTDAPTVRDILWAHAYDEAWVPDVLAGKSVADGDPHKRRDLLGDDPIATYDALNDAATRAVRENYDPDATLHFQYGDYPASEGLAHLAMYRGFQSWSIAHVLGMQYHLPAEVIAGLDEHVMPHAEEWRQWGVFPPALPVPEGADPETRILHESGYWLD
ncbi:MAG: hypothetical protein J0G30_10720 [Actinomycetales bacterium]|nr:hypothetical protein [Actinomycetales bacterium]